MSGHTATPWIDGPYGQIWVGVHQVDGKWDEAAPRSAVIVASVSQSPDLPSEANRALIVKAVNSHERMVALLQRARPFVEIDDGEHDGRLLSEINALLAEVSP